MTHPSYSFPYRPARLLLAAILLATASVAGAQLLGQSKPSTAPKEDPSTLILSDTLHYDDAAKESTFTGSVVMTRGLMTMTSDVLVLREDAQGFQYGTATVNKGKRVFIRQERPENFEVLEGVGQRAEYDGKTEIFDLIGQAVVTRFICGQPFDTISGQKVRYHQKTDVYEAFAGPESTNPDGRVRSVAQPRSRTDAAVAACKELKGVPGAAGAAGASGVAGTAGTAPATKSPTGKAPAPASPAGR
ncbi:MAG: lipopolysaccharide transport periplasmic protein LptA [Burkholderiales bacterium]